MATEEKEGKGGVGVGAGEEAMTDYDISKEAGHPNQCAAEKYLKEQRFYFELVLLFLSKVAEENKISLPPLELSPSDYITGIANGHIQMDAASSIDDDSVSAIPRGNGESS